MFGETLNVILLTFLYSSATLAEVVIAGNDGSSVAKTLLADPAKLSESLFRTDPGTKVIDPGMPEEPSTQPIVEGNKPFGQDTVKPIQPEDVVKDNHPSQPILSGPDDVDQLLGDKQGTALENKAIYTILKSDDKAAEAENPPTNPGAGPVMIEKPLDVKSTAENVPADMPERVETPSSERLEEENKALIPLMPGPVMIEKPLDVKSTAENVPADMPERVETPSSERLEEENKVLIPLMPGPVMIEKPLDVKSTAENVPADIPERIETPSSERLEEENKVLIPLMPGPVMIEKPLDVKSTAENVPADMPERVETPSSERSEEENRALIPLMPGPVMIEKPLDVKSTAENVPADMPERVETPSSERLEEENKALIPLMPGPVMIEEPLGEQLPGDNVPTDMKERVDTPSTLRKADTNDVKDEVDVAGVDNDSTNVIDQLLNDGDNQGSDIPVGTVDGKGESESKQEQENFNNGGIYENDWKDDNEDEDWKGVNEDEDWKDDNEDEDWKGVNEDEGWKDDNEVEDWKDDNEDEGWDDEDKEDEGEQEDLEDKDNEDEGDWYDDADGWATGSTDGSATVTEKPDDFWEKFEDNDYYDDDDDDDENSSGDSKGSEDLINAGQVLMESPHHFDSPLWALGGVKVFNGQVKEGVVPLFSDKREDLFSDDFQARQQSASMINVFSWMLLSLLFVIALAFFIHWNKRLVINYVAIWRGQKPRYGEENKNLLGHEYA